MLFLCQMLHIPHHLLQGTGQVKILNMELLCIVVISGNAEQISHQAAHFLDLVLYILNNLLQEG